MSPRRRKWTPGGPNEPQEAKMSCRRSKWPPGAPNELQEAQMNPRRSKWAPGCPNEPQNAQMSPRRPKPKRAPGGPNEPQEPSCCWCCCVFPLENLLQTISSHSFLTETSRKRPKGDPEGTQKGPKRDPKGDLEGSQHHKNHINSQVLSLKVKGEMSQFLKILIISLVLKTLVKSTKILKIIHFFMSSLSILENVVFPWREQQLYLAEPVETIPTILGILSVSENIDYFIGFISKRRCRRNE